MYEIVLEPEFEAIRELRQSGAETSESDLRREARDLIKARLGLGPDVLSISSDLNEPLRIRVRGKDLFEKAKEALGVPHLSLAFRMVEEVDVPTDQRGYQPPEHAELLESWQGYGSLLVNKRVDIEGRRVVIAQPTKDEVLEEPAILLGFDEEGTKQLANLSRKRLGERIAIVLGDKVLVAPYINEPMLEGRIEVSGGFTTEDARRLSVQISSGAIPPLFTVIEERALPASAADEN